MNESRLILLAVALGLFIPSSFAQQEDQPISEQIIGTWKAKGELGNSITFQTGGKGRFLGAGLEKNKIDITWELLEKKQIVNDNERS